VSVIAASVETLLREQVAAVHNRRRAELCQAGSPSERRLSDRLAVVATLRLVLEGAGGGERYLLARDGDMRVEATSGAALFM
jgi:hypothetical protein